MLNKKPASIKNISYLNAKDWECQSYQIWMHYSWTITTNLHPAPVTIKMNRPWPILHLKNEQVPVAQNASLIWLFILKISPTRKQSKEYTYKKSIKKHSSKISCGT